VIYIIGIGIQRYKLLKEQYAKATVFMQEVGCFNNHRIHLDYSNPERSTASGKSILQPLPDKSIGFKKF
jgi:hypothetical protein